MTENSADRKNKQIAALKNVTFAYENENILKKFKPFSKYLFSLKISPIKNYCKLYRSEHCENASELFGVDRVGVMTNVGHTRYHLSEGVELRRL